MPDDLGRLHGKKTLTVTFKASGRHGGAGWRGWMGRLLPRDGACDAELCRRTVSRDAVDPAAFEVDGHFRGLAVARRSGNSGAQNYADVTNSYLFAQFSGSV
jgi:hypothetical protein